jgi:hypothetical protein
MAELERENAGLKRALSRLLARGQVLESLVQDLQARLAANSSNSSRPPASDGPGATPPQPPATPSGLRRGGQPGHPRHERRLLPPQRVTQTTTLLPPGVPALWPIPPRSRPITPSTSSGRDSAAAGDDRCVQRTVSPVQADDRREEGRLLRRRSFPGQRQICRAHLLRHLKGLADYGEQARRIGNDLLACGKKMSDQWHRVRAATLTRAAFQQLMTPLSGEILRRLQEGSQCDAPKVAGRCREILKLEGARCSPRCGWPAWSRQTMWRSGRSRPAVLWRKGRFGTDSGQGSRFVERILTRW